MTLEKLLAKACSLKISEEQASGIEQSIGRPDSVNRLGNKPSHKPFVPGTQDGAMQEASDIVLQGLRNKDECSKVHQVVAVPNSPPQVSSSDEEYLYTLGKQSGKLPVPETTVGVNGVLVKMMVDTGASTDILDEETFSKIAKSTKIELKEASARIFAY